MMTIDEIADKRPHLSDALRLYGKVQAFERSVLDLNLRIAAEDVSYPHESVETILKSFSSVFEIPEDSLSPLKEALALGQIDLTRLPLNEYAGLSLSQRQDELSGVLFLISKPFFIRLRSAMAEDYFPFWEEGRCPVCNAVPSLSFIQQDEARKLHCSYCGYTGPWHRIGCPNCQNRDSVKLEIIEAEGEKGFRIDLCNECKSYTKTARNYLLADYTPDLIDIVSIPLDIIAQGKGYRRHSPNPIGMITIA